MVQASVEVLRHAYQEAKGLLHVQARSLVNLRANASTLLGFDGVILGLGVAGFTVFWRRTDLVSHPQFAVALFAAGTLAVLSSTVAATWCLLPKRLVGGLPEQRLVEVMEYSVTEDAFLAQAIRAYARFIAANNPHHRGHKHGRERGRVGARGRHRPLHGRRRSRLIPRSLIHARDVRPGSGGGKEGAARGLLL